jgi:xanthine dehydrogenase small subunit
VGDEGVARHRARVFIGHLDELRRIEETEAGVTFGANVSYSQARAVIARRHPQLLDLWDRIGGEQIRNMGTLGGNVANGSPIGDTPPALIALGARLRLRGASGARETALEDFFVDYGVQDLRPDEFVESIFVPAPPPGALLACYKVTKRRDEDISTVCAAFRLTFEGDWIADVRVAYGGMAGTPRRAPAAEAALRGRAGRRRPRARPWRRWSATSRRSRTGAARPNHWMLVAKNLILRLHLETSGASGDLRLARAPAEAF